MSVEDLPPPFHSIRLTSHPLRWEHVFHQHDFWQLVFVQKGQGEVLLGKIFQVGEGRLTIMPPECRHCWRNIGPESLVLFNLHILSRGEGLGSLGQLLAAVCPKCPNTDAPAIAPPRKRLRELLESVLLEIKHGDYGYRHQAAALLTEMVVGAVRCISEQDSRQQVLRGHSARIMKALWYLEKNFNKQVTLDDLAKELSLSPKHVCRIFREELAISPLAQLRKLRIEKAKVFLEETELSAKEIAFSTGFSDEHYFHRLFRKLSGMTPQIYRRRRREL